MLLFSPYFSLGFSQSLTSGRRDGIRPHFHNFRQTALSSQRNKQQCMGLHHGSAGEESTSVESSSGSIISSGDSPSDLSPRSASPASSPPSSPPPPPPARSEYLSSAATRARYAANSNRNMSVEDLLLRVGVDTEDAERLSRRNRIMPPGASQERMEGVCRVLETQLGMQGLVSVLDRSLEILGTGPEELQRYIDFLRGIGVKRLTRFLSLFPSMPEDPERIIGPRVKYLRDLGVVKTGRVLEFFPQYLLIPESTADAVIQYLRRLGVRRMKPVIEQLPTVLGLSVENNLGPRIAFFAHLGLTPAQIASMIERYPPVLGYSLSRRIAPVIIHLREQFLTGGYDTEALPAFIASCPRVLCVNPLVLRDRIAFMNKEFGMSLLDDPLFPTKDPKACYVKAQIRKEFIPTWKLATIFRRGKSCILTKAGLTEADWQRYEERYDATHSASPSRARRDDELPPHLQDQTRSLLVEIFGPQAASELESRSSGPGAKRAGRAAAAAAALDGSEGGGSSAPCPTVPGVFEVGLMDLGAEEWEGEEEEGGRAVAQPSDRSYQNGNGNGNGHADGNGAGSASTSGPNGSSSHGAVNGARPPTPPPSPEVGIPARVPRPLRGRGRPRKQFPSEGQSGAAGGLRREPPPAGVVVWANGQATGSNGQAGAAVPLVPPAAPATTA